MNSRDLIGAWIAAVNNRDLETLDKLYSEDAVLLATFDPKTARTPEERRAYFTRLAQRPGLQVRLHERTLKILPLAPGWESASGIYQFAMEIDGVPLVFEARFTMVSEPNATRPIHHHHSSQIPRTLS